MRKMAAAARSLVFFLLAPGPVAGLTPWRRRRGKVAR